MGETIKGRDSCVRPPSPVQLLQLLLPLSSGRGERRAPSLGMGEGTAMAMGEGGRRRSSPSLLYGSGEPNAWGWSFARRVDATHLRFHCCFRASSPLSVVELLHAVSPASFFSSFQRRTGRRNETSVWNETKKTAFHCFAGAEGMSHERRRRRPKKCDVEEAERRTRWTPEWCVVTGKRRW